MDQKWVWWVVAAVIVIGGWYVLTSSPANVDIGTRESTPRGEEVSFKISAEAGRFAPSAISARRGDLVIIEFTAVDGTYDIGFEDPAIGFDIEAAPGKTKVFGFRTADRAPGDYVFRCFDSCPRGPMTGTLTITQ